MLRYHPFFPADHHQLEPLVLEHEVTRVKIGVPEEIRFYRIDLDGIFAEKLIDVSAGEIVVRDRPEALDQFVYLYHKLS